MGRSPAPNPCFPHDFFVSGEAGWVENVAVFSRTFSVNYRFAPCLFRGENDEMRRRQLDGILTAENSHALGI